MRKILLIFPLTGYEKVMEIQFINWVKLMFERQPLVLRVAFKWVQIKVKIVNPKWEYGSKRMRLNGKIKTVGLGTRPNV